MGLEGSGGTKKRHVGLGGDRGEVCGAGGLGRDRGEARGGSLGRGLTLHRATSGGCKPQMPGRQPGVEMFFFGLRRREVKAMAVLLRHWPVSPQGASCSGF